MRWAPSVVARLRPWWLTRHAAAGESVSGGSTCDGAKRNQPHGPKSGDHGGYRADQATGERPDAHSVEPIVGLLPWCELSIAFVHIAFIVTTFTPRAKGRTSPAALGSDASPNGVLFRDGATGRL